MEKRADLVTVVAIGVLAYVISDLVHEGVGHGGTCLAVGGRVVGMSTAWLDCDASAVSRNAARAVSAGGTVANLVVGASVLAFLRTGRPGLGAAARYLAWLLMVVSLLQGGSYLMVSPILGFGDWGSFLEGYGPTATLASKVVLTALGISISVGTVVVGRRLLLPLLPAGVQASEARRLCLVPYVAAALVFFLAALRDPLPSVALTGVASALLGGTAWLAWIIPFTIKNMDGAAGTAIPRARGLWIAGVVVALVCMLGTSVQFL